MIELPDDFRDFLIALHEAGAAFHGHVRATKNLDVLVRADAANAIGIPPRRIDVLNRASGITFEEAVAEGRAFELEGRSIPILGLGALLASKRAAGRSQDLADVEALEALG